MSASARLFSALRRRPFLSAAVALAVLLCLLVVAAYVAMQTGPGRAALARYLEAALSRSGRIEVTIGRIEGQLPGKVRIDEVDVADRDGTWLKVNDLAVDWRPLELLRGRLQIVSASAGRITVDRRPVGGESGDGGGTPSIPPLAVTVDRLAVKTLQLKNPVLGTAASLRAEAGLSIGQDAAHASLEVVRTDAVAGRATAVIDYDRATGVLDLDGRLSEPQGGLVARLLRLPQLPAIDFSVVGEGSAAKWRGHVALDAAGLASLKSALTVSIGATDARIGLDGIARPEAASGPDAIALLGPETEFVLAATWPHGADRLSLAVEHLRSAAMDVDGTVDLALSSTSIDGTIRIETRDASRLVPVLAPARITAATLDGRLTGSLRHPAVQMNGTIDGPGIGAWSADRMRLEARLQPDSSSADANIGIDGNITLTQPRSPLPELDAAFGDEVRIAVVKAALEQGTRLRLGEGTVGGAGVRGSMTGSIGFDTGHTAAAGDIEIDDVSPLSARVGRPVQGRLRSSYRVSYEPAEGLFVGLDGTLYRARFGAPVGETLVGPAAGFAGTIERGPDGHWRISDVALTGAGATATGRLSIRPAPATIEAEYAVRIDDLGALGVADPARPEGYLEITGTASGPATTPVAEGVASLVDAVPGGLAVNRLTARYSLAGPVRALNGRADIEGESDLLPNMSGKVRFAFENGTIRLSEIDLSARGTALSGDLAVPLAGPPFTGALSAQTNDLAAWSAVAGRPLAGEAKTNITLSADGADQAIALNADVKTLRLGDSVASRRLTVSGTISDALGTPRLALAAKSGAARAGPLEFDTLNLEIAGTIASATYTLRARGNVGGPARVEASGSIRRSGNRTELTVTSLSGEVLAEPIALRGPATAAIGPGISAMDVDLTVGAASLRGSLKRTPADVSLRAVATTVPLPLLWPAAPAQAGNATIDAEIALDGPAVRPRGDFRISIAGIAAGGPEATSGLALTMNGRLRDQVVTATGRVSGVEGGTAAIDATVPVRFSLFPVDVAIDRAAPLSGRFDFGGPVAPLVALAGPDRHRLTGDADIRLALSGTARDPHITGRVELTGGRYENLDTGTILSDLHVRAHPTNGVLTVDEATAGDGDGGRLSATGEVTIGGNEGMKFALDTTLDKARLVRRDDLTAVSSGTVHLRGNAKERRVTGQLVIDEAEIRLVGGTTRNVVTLDVEEIGTPPGDIPASPPAPPPSNTHLDLGISMPKRVFVRGRGLDSEWAGTLQVTGTTAAARVQGDLHPLRGRYDFLGKIFTLREGSIDFAGGEEINPVLNLSAERRVTDMTAIIRVSGTARKPLVRLESIPDLPQDEILSRILFNKSTGRLSAVEALQLSRAAATMTGATDGGGIMDFARGMLNLDVLQFEAVGEGEDRQTNAEAGKYINDRVYVGVEGGAPGSAGATVEIEITPNLKVESDVGENEEGRIGIKWKHDY